MRTLQPMKKIFIVFAGFVLWSAIFSFASAAGHTLGTNVAGPDGTVFTISTQNGQTVRRPYTSAGAFLSYSFNNWVSTVAASPEDMALPDGSFITPQDGKVFCSDRGKDKGTCYLITNGQKAGFTSENVFHGLGYSFDHILYGDVSFLNTADNISTSTIAHQPGTLVNKDGTIYLVGNNGLVGVPDPTTLKSWGYAFTDVVKANAADNNLATGGVLPGRLPEQIEVQHALPAATPTPAASNQNLSTVSSPVSFTPAATAPASAPAVNGGGGGGGTGSNGSSTSTTISVLSTITAPEILSAPTTTTSGVITNFIFVAFIRYVPPANQGINYLVDWGDNTVSKSSLTKPQGLFPPQGFAVSHVWVKTGNYTIIVTAIPQIGSPTNAAFQVSVSAPVGGGSGAANITLTPDPAALSFSIAQGKKDFNKIYIDSNSTQPVNAEAVADNNSWLTLDGILLNGSTVGSVYQGAIGMGYYFWVFVDAANLTPGSYTAQITVNSTANIIKIPVTLTVIQSTSNTPITTPATRVGQLVSNNGIVTYVGNGGLYAFSSANAFNSWGFSFSQVLSANSVEAALPQIGVIPMKQAGSTCASPLEQIAGTCAK